MSMERDDDLADISAMPSRVWSLGSTRWNVFDNSEFETSERGLLIMRTGDTGSAWALGSSELREGRHMIRFEIVQSFKKRGNMHIGFCNGSSAAATSPEEAGGEAVSFHPWEGCLYRWEDWTDQCTSAEAAACMQGDLDGSATGAVVQCLLDMDRRRMAISVNGAAPVDSGLVLSEVCRPMVRLYHKGDSVRLAQWRQEALSCPSPDDDLLLASSTTTASSLLATPTGLVAAAQQLVDATSCNFGVTAGHAECAAVEVALATLEEAAKAARAGVEAARGRLASAPPAYFMSVERQRVEAAVHERTAERMAAQPALEPLPSAVATAAAKAVEAAVKQPREAVVPVGE